MLSPTASALTFHYVSAWEKQRRNSEKPLVVKESFKVTQMICNMDFFTHEAFEETSFIQFVSGIFKILTHPAYNPNRSLEQFWKNVDSFAQKLLNIHPHWIENITQSLERFDRNICIPFMQETL